MHKPTTLHEWLAYIEALHPKSIAMGLERVAMVAKRLGLQPSFNIITVAGTNGKGSVCAMFTQIYTEAGYRVGTYSSPHLIHYHERVKINQQPVSDQALCDAFTAVEGARGDTALTYFEMGTLAAIWLFMQHNIDVAILEVGMGGRLDAVNIFDADCALLTNVDLDHMEFLGDTRELIGAEKAGVYRAGQLSICGDLSPPQSVLAHARQIGTELKLIQQDFHIIKQNGDWLYADELGRLQLPKLSLVGDFQVLNAASVLYAVRAMQTQLPVDEATMLNALANVQLLGRFQFLHRHPDVIVDVAHNPHAARSLKDNILNMRSQGKVLGVFSMLADKDIASVVACLKDCFDAWYIAPIVHPRAASLSQMQALLTAQAVVQPVYSHVSLDDAMLAACKNLSKDDKIVIFGSFFTVANALTFWQTSTGQIHFVNKA